MHLIAPNGPSAGALDAESPKSKNTKKSRTYFGSEIRTCLMNLHHNLHARGGIHFLWFPQTHKPPSASRTTSKLQFTFCIFQLLGGIWAMAPGPYGPRALWPFGPYGPRALWHSGPMAPGLYVYIFINIYIYIHIFIYIFLHLYIFYIYIYIFIYLFIYILENFQKIEHVQKLTFLFCITYKFHNSYVCKLCIFIILIIFIFLISLYFYIFI